MAYAFAGHAMQGLEEGGLPDCSDDMMLLCDGRSPRSGGAARPQLRRRAFVVAVASLAGCAALALTVSSSRHAGRVVEADTNSKVSLFGPLAAVALLAEGASAAKYLPMAEKGFKKMEAPFAKVQENVRNSKPLNLEKYTNLTAEEEIPKENLHDGNLCADDEEEVGGLCYQKCTSLTSGEYPLRTTPWSCCKEQPCTFFNSRFTNPLSLCEGFDVSGKKEGKACPHMPGTCLVNEEFNLGMCFKKCAVLTNNKFPYRSAAGTCCRYNSHWACLDALNTMTDPSFNVGGGAGDGQDLTPNRAHAPMPELAEA